MKQRYFLIVIVGILALILALTGCPLGDNGDDNSDWALPATVGANDVKEKVWYTLDIKVDYAANGTYTKSYSLRYAYNYRPIETGSYSWNEANKTITHKPKTMVWDLYNSASLPLNKKEYQQLIKQEADSWPWFAGWIANQPFTESEWIASRLDEVFAGWNTVYTIAGESLLMQETLPENVEPDQLSGKRYQHMENPDEYYIFSESNYTYFFDGMSRDFVKRIITGAFAYDGINKKVYLTPTLVDGETIVEYFQSVKAYEGHGYPSDAACRAALTNNEFQLIEKSYNPSVSVGF